MAPSFAHHDLLAAVRDLLARALPLDEPPYALALGDAPDAVGFGDGAICASLRLVGPPAYAEGEPAIHDDVAVLCALAGADPAGAVARVEGWLRAVRRVLRDAAEHGFDDAPRITLRQPCGALRSVARAPRARSPEDHERLFLATRDLRDLALPPRAARDAARTQTDAWLATHPVIADVADAEVVAVPVAVRATFRGLWATLELLTYDAVAAGERVLQNIKQQELLLVPMAALADPDRVVAYLDGWAATLPRAIVERWKGDVETLMPHDLLQTDALALKTPRTAADFAVVCARRWKLAP